MPLTVVVSGQAQQFNAITADLGAALAQGYAVRPDGSRYTVTTFLGGYLLDGCPLNVILNQGWMPGQIDALKGAGIMPTCLIPGTVDYFQFYGTTGITTAPPPQAPPGFQPLPPAAPITPVAPGTVPPTIQVTEQPYVPPISAGGEPIQQAGSLLSGMDTTTLLLIGLAIYFLFLRKD